MSIFENEIFCFVFFSGPPPTVANITGLSSREFLTVGFCVVLRLSFGFVVVIVGKALPLVSFAVLVSRTNTDAFYTFFTETCTVRTRYRRTLTLPLPTDIDLNSVFPVLLNPLTPPPPPSLPQLNSQGVYCSLMTGQERREVPFATHVSCTIEMASTTNEYEVAVIDEIQMLADEQRGPSWTAVSRSRKFLMVSKKKMLGVGASIGVIGGLGAIASNFRGTDTFFFVLVGGFWDVVGFRRRSLWRRVRY